MRIDEKTQTEVISFRGNKQLWMEFVYTLRKRGEKSVWSVLRKMIKNYIKGGK